MWSSEILVSNFSDAIQLGEFKRLKHLHQAWDWLYAARQREPRLFAHWGLTPLI
jgi:hypothetical protein